MKSGSESDDKPLASSSPAKSAVTTNGSASNAARDTNGRVNGRRTQPISYRDESSDDDRPLLSQSVTAQTPTPKPVRKRAKLAPESESDDDDLPLSTTVGSSVAPTPVRKRPVMQEEEGSEDASAEDSDSPAPKKRGRKSKEPAKKMASTSKRKSKVKDEPETSKFKKGKDKDRKPPASPRKKKKEEEEEEIFKWWEANDAATQGVDGDGVAPTPEDVLGDGSVKWKTLEHCGVLFPPPYEPLPKHVKMSYDGSLFTTMQILRHPDYL